jgi:hypothetical protein
VQQGDQGGTIGQLAFVDERADLGQRYPFDSVGLGSVQWRALVGGAVGPEEVMAGVGYPVVGS